MARTRNRRKMWQPDVADAAGITQASVARYHSIAETSRRNAEQGMTGRRQPKPRDLPAPDGYAYPPGGRTSGSKSPWWWDTTLAPWLAARTGITPGRPRDDGKPAVRRKPTHARPGPKRTAAA